MDKTKGYRLKPLAIDLLGKKHRDEYKDIVQATQTRSQWVAGPASCACGVDKCKKRSLPAHAKTRDLVEKLTEYQAFYQLEDIVPGHPHWEKLLEYAGADAVDALELDELCWLRIAALEKIRPPLPW